MLIAREPQVWMHGVNRTHCTPQATVVNRELVAVLTRGTLTDAEMLASTPDASYLMAITEGTPAGPRAADGIDVEPVTIGVCAVDAATGQMLLGQWCGFGLCRRSPVCWLAAPRVVKLSRPACRLWYKMYFGTNVRPCDM
jgi:DNA mismatch repair ATPase MutS